MGFTGSLPVDVCYKPAWSMDGFCFSTADSLIPNRCSGAKIQKLPLKTVSYSKEMVGSSGFTWKPDYSTNTYLGWGSDGCLYAGINSSGVDKCSRVACPKGGTPTITPEDTAATAATKAWNLAENAIDESSEINLPTVPFYVLVLFFALALVLAVIAYTLGASVLVFGGTVGAGVGAAWG